MFVATVTAPLRPAWATIAGPWGKVGVVPQDALVELGQHRSRLGALVLDEPAAGFPVEAERLARPAAEVEGRHLVGDERLIQRVLG